MGQKLLILLFLLLPSLSMAQDKFIEMCEAEEKTVERDLEIKWLKFLFKTEDCRKIADEIKGKKSFTEILPSERFKIKLGTQETWMDHVPHYRGIDSEEKYPRFIEFNDRDKSIKIFYALDLLQEFKNLTHLNLLGLNHLPVCELVKALPQLKTVTITPKLLEADKADHCLASAKIKIYLADNVGLIAVLMDKVPESTVIGVEGWVGELTFLSNYQDIQFIDVSSTMSEDKGVEALMSLPNLSHLSLYGSKLVNNQGLRHLDTLQFLSIQSFRYKEFANGRTNVLNDISFVKDLTYLKELYLNYNDIEDLSPVLELENLEVLNVQNNNLRVVGDMSGMLKLKELNLGFNSIVSVKGIAKAPALKLLKLTRNKIGAFEELAHISTLEALDLSQNFLGGRVILPVMPSLKYLAINGYLGRYNTEQTLSTGMYKSMNSAPIKEAMDHLMYIDHWNYSSTRSCEIRTYIDEVIGLENLTGLIALSISGQEVTSLPGIEKLINLRQLIYTYNDKAGILNLKMLPLIESVNYQHTVGHVDYWKAYKFIDINSYLSLTLEKEFKKSCTFLKQK